MARHIVLIEPLASIEEERVVEALAPTIQRYLCTAQKPNLTSVKYQRLEVLQSATRRNSVPPASGTSQRGWSRSWTYQSFTARTP